MTILIVDNGSIYLDKLVNLFGGNEVEVVAFSSFSGKDLSYDLVVLSGGHVFDLEKNKDLYKKEFDFILSSKIPILGICLGCEIIVKAFGGDLKTLDHYEKGVLSVNLVKESPLFSNVESTFEVYENHRKIIESLPDCLEKLAVSVDGVEILKHKEKLIFGFQFHPEMFADIGVNNQMISNLIKMIEEKKFVL